MNRMQKIAWSFVIATSLGFVCSIIAVAILYVKVGMPKALVGLAFMGIAGLGGLSAIFIKKDKGKVTFDERDALIKKNAAHAGFAGAFLFTCFVCMIPFFVLGPKASISVRWLPQIWIGTFVTQFFFYSIAILIQYGWTSKGEKS
jgi:hypothetical protein